MGADYDLVGTVEEYDSNNHQWYMVRSLGELLVETRFMNILVGDPEEDYQWRADNPLFIHKVPSVFTRLDFNNKLRTVISRATMDYLNDVHKYADGFETIGIATIDELLNYPHYENNVNGNTIIGYFPRQLIERFFDEIVAQYTEQDYSNTRLVIAVKVSY